MCVTHTCRDRDRDTRARCRHTTHDTTTQQQHNNTTTQQQQHNTITTQQHNTHNTLHTTQHTTQQLTSQQLTQKHWQAAALVGSDSSSQSFGTPSKCRSDERCFWSGAPSLQHHCWLLASSSHPWPCCWCCRRVRCWCFCCAREKLGCVCSDAHALVKQWTRVRRSCCACVVV